jgi:hypothetical protein
MMEMVMGQLKNFSGEGMPATPQETMPQEPPVNKEKQLTDIPGTTENLEARIEAIDKQLRQSDLTDEEINRLLDERRAIMKELRV